MRLEKRALRNVNISRYQSHRTIHCVRDDVNPVSQAGITAFSL